VDCPLAVGVCSSELRDVADRCGQPSQEALKHERAGASLGGIVRQSRRRRAGWSAQARRRDPSYPLPLRALGKYPEFIRAAVTLRIASAMRRFLPQQPAGARLAAGGDLIRRGENDPAGDAGLAASR
jgi:hypothetical protein